MRVLVGFIAVGTAILLAFSYAGALHPAGDSFAVVRVPLAIAVFLSVTTLSFVSQNSAPFGIAVRWFSRLLVFLAFFSVLVPIFAPRLFSSTASDYDFVLYQQNLLFVRQDDAAWLEEVASQSPHFLTLQEVSGRNKALLDAMSERYPTQVYCDFASVGGVAVLSVYPIVDGTQECADRDGVAAVQLDTPHGLVWLISIHLHWPWPYGQAAQVGRLVPILDQFEGHVIIGGDLNAVAWSDTVSRLARASGTALVGPHAPTFHVLGVPVGIDHVLTSPAYAQEVRVVPKLGSDHHGVIAYLNRPIAP